MGAIFFSCRLKGKYNDLICRMQKFKKILLAIGWILSYIFPLRVKFFLENVITIIRSGYYRRRFKFFPISSRIGLGFCGKGLEYISIGEKMDT